MDGRRGDEIVLSMAGERFTPFTLAKKLGAKAILESASFKQGRERYSLLLADEAFRVRQEKGGVSFGVGGVAAPWTPPTELQARRKGPCDILDALAYVASQNAGVAPTAVPASGIGFLGYGFAARCDTIRLAANRTVSVFRSRVHRRPPLPGVRPFTDTIHVIALNYAEHEIDLEARIAD
jgi:anthranilate synthase component 1